MRNLITELKRRLLSKGFYPFVFVGFFLLALGVRLTWVVYVQFPGNTIYSDMNRYMNRATNLAEGTQEPHLNLACFPYGTHYLYALEMHLFGTRNHLAMSIVQGLLSAFTALFAMFAVRRCFSSLVATCLIGLLMSFWYPLISFCGFFSSETPFAFFVYLSLWLWIRYAQTGKGAFWAGLSAAVGFTFRPQLIMTAALSICWIVFQHLSRGSRTSSFRWRSLVLLVVPMVLIVGYSAYRHHEITGRYHLISDNGAIGRFFADTNYRRIIADRIRGDGSVITKKNGKPATRTFQPPARSSRNGFKGVYQFEGHIANPEALDKERKRVQADLSLLENLEMRKRNLYFLFLDNLLWPERREAKEGTRKLLLLHWNDLFAYIVCPLALVGIVTLVRRRNLGLELAAIHIATMLYAAIFYFGEVRYRVPYDGICLMLALQAIWFFARKERTKDKQSRYAGGAIGALLCILIALLLVPWNIGE